MLDTDVCKLREINKMASTSVTKRTWAARLVENIPHHDGVVISVPLAVVSVHAMGQEADVVLK
jgi:hypothetical protein